RAAGRPVAGRPAHGRASDRHPAARRRRRTIDLRPDHRPTAADASPGRPTLIRLSELALAKRSVTILLAVGLFIAGISAWGSLKQELLPDIQFPVITIVAPFPGAGSADVAAQVAQPIE